MGAATVLVTAAETVAEPAAWIDFATLAGTGGMDLDSGVGRGAVCTMATLTSFHSVAVSLP